MIFAAVLVQTAHRGRIQAGLMLGNAHPGGDLIFRHTVSAQIAGELAWLEYLSLHHEHDGGYDEGGE